MCGDALQVYSACRSLCSVLRVAGDAGALQVWEQTPWASMPAGKSSHPLAERCIPKEAASPGTPACRASPDPLVSCTREV